MWAGRMASIFMFTKVMPETLSVPFFGAWCTYAGMAMANMTHPTLFPHNHLCSEVRSNITECVLAQYSTQIHPSTKFII